MNLTEWPSLKFDCKPTFGFDLDLGVFGPVSSSAEMETTSGKLSSTTTMASCCVPPKIMHITRDTTHVQCALQHVNN